MIKKLILLSLGLTKNLGNYLSNLLMGHLDIILTDMVGKDNKKSILLSKIFPTILTTI
jgi:hypothetical protein